MYKWTIIVKYVWKTTETKNKYRHFKSKSHSEFNKCKYIVLSHKDIDINDVYEAFSLYIIEREKNSIIIS